MEIEYAESQPLLKKPAVTSPRADHALVWLPKWEVIVMIIYFSIGVVFYSKEESMSVVRSLYFCMITFTTVGFGDFTPSTTSCKVFTCVFVFVGLAIIASLLSDLLDRLVEKRDKEKKEKLQERFNEEDKVINDELTTEKPVECDTMCPFSVPSFAVPIVQGLRQALLIIAVNVFIGTIAYSYIVDDFSLVDAFYLSCMTVTTVGYGDISPSNNTSRAFTILYALLGTIITGEALSKFASAVSDYKQAKMEAAVLSRPLTCECLIAMDSDKTNIGVSFEEFVLYKLKAMGAVDLEIIHRAEAQFRKLDITKTGYLSIDDIKSFEGKCQFRR